MISVDEALQRMLACARFLGREQVDCGAVAGRVLAEQVRSDCDFPPFDKSAMDGFACRRADLGSWVAVGETVPAGRMPTQPVIAGHCTRIMTGAPVPVGAECVAVVEEVEVGADGRVRLPVTSAGNICRKGEDLGAGAAVLESGTLLGPAHVAVLASVGCVRPQVARRPRVAVLATGAELVEPDQPVVGASIRDSNSRQICAQVAAMGAMPLHLGIVSDDEAAIDAAVAKAQAEADVVVLSGGVSEGDFDLVPQVLERRGFRLHVTRVALQPGRALAFGDDGRGWCLGLPGNPVAGLVVCELLLRPFLCRLMGHDHAPKPIMATLAEPVRRKKTERQAMIPVAWCGPGQVKPVPYHGSAHIDALCRADGLITLPVAMSEMTAGSSVQVRLL